MYSEPPPWPGYHCDSEYSHVRVLISINYILKCKPVMVQAIRPLSLFCVLLSNNSRALPPSKDIAHRSILIIRIMTSI